MKKLKRSKTLFYFALFTFIGTTLMAAVTESRGTPGPIIDTAAPIPVWTVLSFLATWVLGWLGYRMQFRKFQVDAAEKAEEKRLEFIAAIQNECKTWNESESARLILERKIGTLAEKIAQRVLDEALKNMVSKELFDERERNHQLKHDLLEANLKNDVYSRIMPILETVVPYMGVKK